jgi:hypothetical protein
MKASMIHFSKIFIAFSFIFILAGSCKKAEEITCEALEKRAEVAADKYIANPNATNCNDYLNAVEPLLNCSDLTEAEKKKNQDLINSLRATCK